MPAVREVEHKFQVHGLYRLPELVDGELISSVDEQDTVEQETKYYDTPDLRLAREGITLRRRTGGHDAGWHLKLRVPDESPGVRDELRVPLTDGADGTPPTELLDVVRPITRRDPVDVVVTLRTTRTTNVVRDASGRIVAELVDDLVRVVDDSGRPVAQFRELEVEERDGVAPRLVEQLVEKLTGSGAVAGEMVSKAVRALGPQASAPSEVPEPADVGPGEPVRDAVRAYLARHTRALRAADLAYRRDPEAGAEPVHDMRVAIRRLRSGLRFFRPLVDRTWADELRDELKWAGKGLGELRRLDVLIARLERQAQAVPADLRTDDLSHIVLGRSHEEREQARAEVRALLSADRYVDLHAQLVSASNAPPTTDAAEQPGREALPALVRKAWKRLAKRAKAALDADAAESSGGPGASDDDWHQVRIAAKRARYAAEAVAPVLGSDAKALARQVERVTDALGEQQDAADAIRAIRELTASADAPASFTLGFLYGAEQERIATVRRRFTQLWPKVRRRKWRRWLTS
ncbi:MAG: CYTH and CHAD domain-containing protein [Jiangellaceae bacterium]|nr:CYTH and CHAD domain-containing protein [Jiangellaceae bacterium]